MRVCGRVSVMSAAFYSARAEQDHSLVHSVTIVMIVIMVVNLRPRTCHSSQQRYESYWYRSWLALLS